MSNTEGEAPAAVATLPAAPAQDVVLTELALVLPSPAPPEEPPADPKEAAAEEQGGGEEAKASPAEEEPAGPSYEAVLLPGGAAVPLIEVAAEGLEEGMTRFEPIRPLKGLQSAELCLHVREVRSEGDLFVSAPLAELEGVEPVVGSGPSGAIEAAPLSPGGAAAEGTPAEGCSFTCGWRVQRALPVTGKLLAESTTDKFRTRPLAFRYSAPKDRTEFETRLNTWRAELSENITVPPSDWSATLSMLDDQLHPFGWREGNLLENEQAKPESWTQAWRQPYRPHHLLGDARTQGARAAYIHGATEDAILFRAQAVAVDLKRLQDQLPGCVTAEQAVSALTAIRDFLDEQAPPKPTIKSWPNIEGDPARAPRPQKKIELIDASLVLKQIKNLRLPFERLVRNVWEEGPEVMYDRTKASLQRTLQKELARRKEEAKAEAAATSYAVAHSMPPARNLPATMGISNYGNGGVRTGLLHFSGRHSAAHA
jgi:hypothetical protein